MLFANNCNTTLNGGITAVATSMVVTSAAGFPAPTGSQYFYCTLADAATQTTIEIVKVTAVSGTTFTIVRGQDGTTGTIFASGAVVSLRLVAASLNDFPKLDEANTFTGANAYGTPASIVLTNASGTASININGTVGATTASTGAFTTLSASSTVSGTGFSTYLASPPAIGGTAAAAGKFTTLAATGVFTASSGTAALPSIVTLSGSTSGLYSSTANVLGVAISATSIGTFTSTGLNGMAVGATTASTGAFTTLSASSTVSGTGFSTYLASPPAIGGTAAAAVTGSNLMSSGGVWAKGLYAGTTYTDGLVIDYVSPTARFSAGTSDGFAWYNGGVGTTTLMTLSSTGAIGTATWNGATVGVAYGGTGTATAFTAGSVVFAGASGVYTQDNANLFWDNTNKRLGIGITTPNAFIDIYSASQGYAGIGLQGYSSATKWYVLSGISGVSISPFVISTNGAGTSPAVCVYPSGGVSIGNTTDAGANNLSVTGSASAASFIPTSATVPNNGLYLPAANSVGFATNSTERMRIDSSGNLLVGNTIYNGANAGGIQVGASSIGAIYVGHATGTASGNPYMQYNYNGTSIGSITQAGTTGVLYNVTSDYRLKSNVTPIQDALSIIQSLKPVSFTWVDGRLDDGFIAHELQAVIPNCVTGEKDAVNEDGTPKYQQMDSSGVIPFLVKAVQELTDRLIALESK